MPQPNDRRHVWSKLGPLPAIGLAGAGIVLAAWCIAVIAVFTVASVLVAAVSCRMPRWLESGPKGRANGPIIIDAEYEVLSPETDPG